MDRYSVIHTKMPREFVLLQGRGCRWGKCAFCDYHSDTSDKPFETNRAVLQQVTGVYGVLDVINSGSAPELDEATIELIKKVVREKNIHTLWFEAHYMYRHRLAHFAVEFAPAAVKFRCGIESFSPAQRALWNKGVPATVTAADVAKYFKGVCLLCCTADDSRERIIADIATAKQYFEYFSVNLFCNNSTTVKRNDALAAWFMSEVYPKIKDDERIEVLAENTDLGVG
ncbi:MAG: hypothetical protein IJ436_01650 [Bacteroidaceae bacterium]|nr:hypothetical protein [Bacteroidaceae bacterium]